MYRRIRDLREDQDMIRKKMAEILLYSQKKCPVRAAKDCALPDI